jgi:alpha-ketoglutarate-dependent taurine dioxygenase
LTLADNAYGPSILRGNEEWHTDSTYMPLSSKAALLYAEVLPSAGTGGTAWADMRAAHDALDEATRQRVSGLRAYHSTQYSTAVMGRRADGGAYSGGALPVCAADCRAEGVAYGFHGDCFLRPLVKRHPATGRDNLLIGRHAFGLCGAGGRLPRPASEALLASLVAFACGPAYAYQHEWAVGELAVWDNRRLLHRARPYALGLEARVMRGTRVAGEAGTEAGVAAPESRDVLARELALLLGPGPGAEPVHGGEVPSPSL